LAVDRRDLLFVVVANLTGVMPKDTQGSEPTGGN